jgi:hypothetical protein
MPSPYELPTRWFEDCKDLEERVLRVLPEEEIAVREFVLSFLRSLPPSILRQVLEEREKSTSEAPELK